MLDDEAFEEHQRCRQRCSELVRYGHLVVHQRGVSVLCLEDLALELQRLHMVRHVVEVYSRCTLLHEIDALDPHLGELVLLLGQSSDAQRVLLLLG